MTRRARRAFLLTQIRLQQQWLDDHGTTLAGYVARYGSANDADHYGNGGEAIYAADQAELDRLHAALRSLEAK